MDYTLNSCSHIYVCSCPKLALSFIETKKKSFLHNKVFHVIVRKPSLFP